MARIEETIPEQVAPQAEAARAWFAHTRKRDFKLTGIVDPERALAATTQDAASQLDLILCGSEAGQDVCLRERFRVRPAETGAGFEVTHVANMAPRIGSPAPLLDPPPEARSGWLDEVIKKHAFVVLVFYRGFW